MKFNTREKMGAIADDIIGAQCCAEDTVGADAVRFIAEANEMREFLNGMIALGFEF